MSYTYISMIFLGQLEIFQWLRNHLLPCPFKYFTGIDCPGCGFQRSLLALMQGDIHDSLYIYPPAIPILLAFIYLFADRYFLLDNKQNAVKKTVYIAVSLIVMVSYGVKMFAFYQHYKMSA